MAAPTTRHADASGRPEVLALIPARSGSKGIPHKNLRLFRGTPLLAHAIHQALNARLITRTIVSTDSDRYAEIARQHGAEVPFLRPAEISGDLATDLETFTHALAWLKREEGYEPDICVHLRPTYPTRRVSDIDAVVGLLIARPELDSVRSVAPAAATPFKMWFRDDGGMLRPVVQTDVPDAHSLPRQSLPPAYLQNACIDAVRAQVIVKTGSMSGSRVFGYVMDQHDDIDTEWEFQQVMVREELAARSVAGAAGARRVICVDIDGVIATAGPADRYEDAQPIQTAIDTVNRLHDAGHEIILFTARGTLTGLDWRPVTERQLKTWDVRYDRLLFGKPAADVYVDDRALSPEQLAALVGELTPTDNGGARE